MRTPSVLAITALVGAAALVATPASAAPLTCGSTVTVSRSLTTDLTCPGDVPALTLAAGVTLNLERHRITGPGTGVGVLVPRNGDVVIRNGTLAGWDTGIATGGIPEDPGSGSLRVDQVTVASSNVGIDVSGKLTTVTGSTFDHAAVASIRARTVPSVRVSASTFIDSTRGLDLTGADTTVSGSRFVRVGGGIDVVDSEVHVSGSAFIGGIHGLTLYLKAVVTVASSVFDGMDIAVDAQGPILPRDQTVVSELTLTGNTFTSNFVAVQLTRVNGTIRGNVIRENDYGLNGPGASITGLLVQGNVLDGNGEGIWFDSPTKKTAVGGNVVIRSSGFAIYVGGATDLGGNVASPGRYDPPCRGVVCVVLPR